MNDTPRTDDAQDHCANCGLDFVLADDARKIELELNAALKELEELRKTANGR